MIVIITIFIIIIAIWIAIISFNTKKWINPKKKIYFKTKISEIRNESNEKRIIQYDTILHKIMIESGYKWNLWEILKSKPKILSYHLQEIWEMHKIRNKLAHEIDYRIDWNKKADRFEEILLDILK